MYCLTLIYPGLGHVIIIIIIHIIHIIFNIMNCLIKAVIPWTIPITESQGACTTISTVTDYDYARRETKLHTDLLGELSVQHYQLPALCKTVFIIQLENIRDWNPWKLCFSRIFRSVKDRRRQRSFYIL